MSKSVIRVKKNAVLPHLFLGYICIYAAVNSLIFYIVPASFLRIIFLAGAVSVFTLNLVRTSISQNKSWILAFFGYIMLVVLVSVPRNDMTTTDVLLLFATLEMTFLIMQRKIDLGYCFRILFAVYIIHAVCTIVLRFTPDFYISRIAPLFPQRTDQLIKLYRAGEMAGLTSHYSVNGVFLVTGLMMTFSMFFAGNRSLKNKLYILVFLIALLLTGKRGQLVFGLFALFILYYIWQMQRGKNFANKWLRVLGFVLVFLVILVLISEYIPALAIGLQRIQVSLETGDLDHGRYEIWNLAFQQVKNSPVFGIGWGAFKSNISAALGSSRLYDVHNVYLQLLCETGIVGLVLFLFFFVYCLFHAFSVYSRILAMPDMGYSDRYFAGFSLVYQIFFLLYCMTGNPLYDLFCYIPYFMCCGVTLYYVTVFHKKM